MHEIADTLKKVVPRLIIRLHQKQSCVDDLERCLELFKSDKMNFLPRYVTIDEYNQKELELSRQQPVKVVQSDQKLRGQLAG